MEAAIVFYTLAVILIYFGYKTITAVNPIHSALYLALTMIGLAFQYFMLNAQFVAWVQLIVYAGAVMVLFLMVLMLFDLRSESRAFSRGLFSGIFKIGSAAMLAGLLIGVARMTTGLVPGGQIQVENAAESRETTLKLAQLLFSEYLFAFEMLGVLLLVVAIGVVAVSRSKGGTHARH